MNVHYRNLPDDDIDRIPKFFFNGINLTVWENDIAILKIADQGDPLCVQEETFGFITKHIRPACLPKKVSYRARALHLLQKLSKQHFSSECKLCWSKRLSLWMGKDTCRTNLKATRQSRRIYRKSSPESQDPRCVRCRMCSKCVSKLFWHTQPLHTFS